MNDMTQRKNTNLVSEMEKIYDRTQKVIKKTVNAFE